MIKLDKKDTLPIKQRVRKELHEHGDPDKLDRETLYKLHDLYPQMSVLYPYKVVE